MAKPSEEENAEILKIIEQGPITSSVDQGVTLLSKNSASEVQHSIPGHWPQEISLVGPRGRPACDASCTENRTFSLFSRAF
jgi:hypothetical protein